MSLDGEAWRVGAAGESSRETHPWAPFLKKALGVLHIGFWV